MAQIAVIGLSNFGYYLTRELYGKEVLAIDINKEIVQKLG